MTPDSLRRAAAPDLLADLRAFCYVRDVEAAYAEASARLRGDRTPKAPETPPTPRNRLSGANSPKESHS